MKSKMYFLAVLAGAVIVPQSLLAQEYGPDDTTSIRAVKDPDEGVQEEDEDDALRWDFRVTNEVHSFDNLDMRPLDESTTQDILDTDDRHTFGYTSLAAGLSYDVFDDTTFNFGATLSGLWGNDQIGTTTTFGSFAYIYDLSVDWTAYESAPFTLSTTLGRQSYSIGGVRDDFFFKDIVDGVTINADFGVLGRFRILAFDIFGHAGRPDDVDFARFVSGNQQVVNFRGDTNVYRFGGVYELLDIAPGLDLRAFGFGSHIGAARAAQQENETSAGADRSAQGVLANFADNDGTWMAGGRANYTLRTDAFEVGVMGEYARSGGIDRKARHLGYWDVDADGNAYGAGAHFNTYGAGLGFDARLRFFHADGGQYTQEEGLQYSHGFVSMKGSEIGGINMERYAGWHPSSYVSGFEGFSDSPHDIDRKAGTRTLHAGVGILFAEALRLDLDAWYYQDTTDTNFDVSRAEEVGSETEWGYNEAELRAQERFGKTLGYELNAALSYAANEALSLYAIGGIFLPGEFYEIEIDRTAGTALGAPGGDPDQLENFWTVSAGATLAF